MYRTEKSFMRDPATANCRIYVGNLDESTTSDSLEEHFKKHGKVVGVIVQRGFGFIQFEDENSAQESIKNEHGVMFQGRKLNVKQAFDNKNKQNDDQSAGNVPKPANSQDGPPRKMLRRGGGHGGRGRGNSNMSNMDRDLDRPPHMDDIDYNYYRDGPSYYGREDHVAYSNSYNMNHDRRPAIPERNDCEIIVISKQLTEYAEYIEQRLKAIGLTVDLLFPNEDVPIGRVLANISSRGCLYAILVMPQNEEHRSLTLNILHGLPKLLQEHRNMPVDDAVALISRNFDAYMRGDKSLPSAMPNTPVSLTDRHPEPIQFLINLLAENRALTTLQYDRIIKYLQDKRELQYKQEVGDAADLDNKDQNTKQAELQNRIMSILNQTSPGAPSPVTAPTFPLVSTVPQPVPKPAAPLLNDPSVQKALDSLMQGDLLKNITAANRF